MFNLSCKFLRPIILKSVNVFLNFIIVYIMYAIYTYIYYIIMI